MKQRYYVIFDKTSKLYTSPMFFVNDDTAKREIANIMRDENHNFTLNPEHYDLYYLYEFDTETAVIELPGKKQYLSNLKDLKVKVLKRG